MLYLAIDQHRKQLTVNLRNEAGDVILKRQVSTEWKRVREFMEEVRNRSVPEGGFVAIVEVCGFNDWFLKLLAEYGCREIVLVQPEKRSKNKTDRRDANALGELLWTNRERLLAGKKVQNVRRVVPPSRARCGRPPVDGVAAADGPAANANDQQGAAPAVEAQLAAGMSDQGPANQGRQEVAGEAAAGRDRPPGTGSTPGPMGTLGQAVGGVGSEDCASVRRKTRRRRSSPRFPAPGPTAAWPWPRRIGSIERFPHARSLANYWGLTPGSQQLRGRHATPGLDHQGGQRHGAIHPRADGAARVASRCPHEGVVSSDQEAARGQDRAGGGDASFGDHNLAHAVSINNPTGQAARIRKRAILHAVACYLNEMRFLRHGKGLHFLKKRLSLHGQGHKTLGQLEDFPWQPPDGGKRR